MGGRGIFSAAGRQFVEEDTAYAYSHRGGPTRAAADAGEEPDGGGLHRGRRTERRGGAGVSGRGRLRRSGAGHHDAACGRNDGAADAARPGQRPAGAAADSPGRRSRPGRRTGRGRRRLPHQALCHGRAAGAAAGTDPEKRQRQHQCVHPGRSDGGYRRADSEAGRPDAGTVRQGICAAGIPYPQQGRGTVPAADRGQPVEPGLRRGHQCGGRIHQLSAEEVGTAR